MRRFASALALFLVLLTPFLSSMSAAAQAVTCASFDAWPWAQTVMDSDPDQYTAALDPDGNGIACEQLPIGGFAPVLWTDAIPANAEPAQVVSVTDGDTFTVSVNGVQDTVRMYHIDTPETTNFGGGLQCGGHEATNYLSYVLGFAPNGIVYLEYDQTQRDQYDRRLAYVWYQIGSDVYMVNEVMVRSGWAESETYKPDTWYKERLDTAEKFSVQKVLGVRLLCGKFGQPADGTAGPSSEQLRQAMNMQPQQGQFAAFIPGSVSTSGNTQQTTTVDAAANTQPVPAQPGANVESAPAQQVSDQEPVYEEPAYEEPVYEEPAPAPEPAAECDPSYPDFCLAPSWVIGDLDCGDIGYRRFTVYPPDSHGFDGDGDGVGCESG